MSGQPAHGVGPRRGWWLAAGGALWIFTAIAGWVVAPALCAHPHWFWLLAGGVAVATAVVTGFGLRGLTHRPVGVVSATAVTLGVLALAGVVLSWLLAGVWCG